MDKILYTYHKKKFGIDSDPVVWDRGRWIISRYLMAVKISGQTWQLLLANFARFFVLAPLTLCIDLTIYAGIIIVAALKFVGKILVKEMLKMLRKVIEYIFQLLVLPVARFAAIIILLITTFIILTTRWHEVLNAFNSLWGLL